MKIYCVVRETVIDGYIYPTTVMSAYPEWGQARKQIREIYELSISDPMIQVWDLAEIVGDDTVCNLVYVNCNEERVEEYFHVVETQLEA